MNDTITNKRLSPKHVITVYTDNHRSNFYLERRDIVSVDGKYVMQAAVPLADDVMKEVAKSYMTTNSTEMDFGGMIPGHLLYVSNKVGNTVVAWYRPAMKRTLNFSDAIKVKGDKSAMVPATLYMVSHGNLHVFALQTDERPTEKTKLYKAPFFNIYSDARVCLGTARIGKYKSKTFEGEAERYERGFYMAEQSGGVSSKQCKTPLAKLWPALIKSQKPFPSEEELIQQSTYKTFADVLNKLSR